MIKKISLDDNPLWPTLPTVAFTGHRPQQLGGYNETGFMNSAIKVVLRDNIKLMYDGGFRRFISGMALGVDIWSAEAVMALKAVHPDIVLVAAIPFAAQADRWKVDGIVERWQKIVSTCDQAYLVLENHMLTPEEQKDIHLGSLRLHEPNNGIGQGLSYGEVCGALAKRNEWMVNRCNTLFAVYNGNPGGTQNCIKYARKRNVTIFRYNPLEPELGVTTDKQ